MRVKKTKKISIITKPEFDESMITNIYNGDTFAFNKSEEFVFNEETNESERINDELIDYRFFFVADLRKVINKNLSTVRFSIRTSQKRNRYSIFSDLLNSNPRGIIAALFAKSTDIKSEMFTSDFDGLIYRKNIDLLKQFDDFKLRNAKRLSDRELFGTIERSKVVNIDKMKKLGKNQLLAQRALTTIDGKFLNSSAFIRNYEKSISLGSDPADLLFPTDDETPADPRKSGTFSRPSLRTGNYSKDSTLFSMRSNIIGSPTSADQSSDKKSISQFPLGSSVAIIEKQLNRMRLIQIDATLKKSDLIGVNKFSIVMDVINDKGLIFQTLKMIINHKRNINDYYAPTSGVDSKITFSFDSNKKAARLTLKKNDPNIAGCDIYLREISESQSLLKSPFRKIKRVKFRDGGNTYNESFHYPVHERQQLSYSESKLTIMRVVPVSKTGKVFGNFTSSVKKNGPFVPFRATIFTRCVERGIILRLGGVSSNVVGACFERRDSY